MAEVRYVQRDRDGNLVGHYANPQPGYAEEAAPGDHPDILAWRTKQAADVAASRLLRASMAPDVLLNRIAVLETELANLKGI